MSARKSKYSSLSNYVILIILASFSFAPLFLLFFNSLKSSMELGLNPLGVPITANFGNYLEAWRLGDYATAMRNSLLVSGTTIVGVLFIAGMGAYALARLKLLGKNILMIYFLMNMALPSQLFVVPLFFLWHRLGLVNTLPGVILVYSSLHLPFSIFLIRSYLVGLPKGFEDAARIDGASEWQVYYKVIVPLSWPVFLTVAVIVATWTWNEFFFALLFLHSESVQTVSIRYMRFSGRFLTDWGLTNAAGVIVSLPIVILFLFLQRRFIEGITGGGLKM